MVALLSGVPPTHTGTGTSRVQGDPAAARVQAGSWFSHVVVGEDRHLWTPVIMLVGLHTGSRQGLLAAPSWDGGGPCSCLLRVGDPSVVPGSWLWLWLGLRRCGRKMRLWMETSWPEAQRDVHPALPVMSWDVCVMCQGVAGHDAAGAVLTWHSHHPRGCWRTAVAGVRG